MLPEVEAYFAARNTATNTFVAERQAMRENPVPEWNSNWSKEEREAYYAADAARQAALVKVRHAAREAEYAADDHLINSDNPLLKWIATESGALTEYRGYVEDVLRALPMSRDEMEVFGDGQDWCDVYRAFLRRAEQAGVLPENDPNTLDLKPLLTTLEEEYGWNRRTRALVAKALRKHLPAILEQAKQAETASA